MKKDSVSRKELAGILSKLMNDEISVTQVMRNEKKWGLDKTRSNLNKRVIRYKLAKSLQVLESKGLILPGTNGSHS